MDLIISQIIGGLGNQMFQFAAGRALSIERGQALHLDISGFADYRLHQGFELARIFAGQFEIATGAEVRRALGWQFSPVVRRVIERPGMSWLRRPSLVVEPHFHYWTGLNSVPSNCYLKGYWQSQKYFGKHASVLRSDFTFKALNNRQNDNTIEEINRVNAVSVHVRRGDFLTNPTTQAKHGICSIEYYRDAIGYVLQRIERPYFFVFSDDMDWVKGNLKIDAPCQYVDRNHGAESYIDMYLMSLCKHNIIANSSFSWWGAWLNSNPEKIVLAPKNWFVHPIDTRDLIPENWSVL
ncbi:MAG: alpha-1,2-fucosyltransferase [Rhodoferax sp.]|uniref:alpha-1,2-fucosyltransferase n=1 Tax=Rhodoferax sp. TaxID=50421 RepID=UPI0026336EC3|nr:alpha-1,2-fucosyltransferase [Rhodoferax sp.]MDD5333374.1 alpha-1,2-fucosyltransferase [Rhodoferax sp.]